jgi:hypothetical protein
MDRDRLNSTPAKDVAHGAMAIITALQDAPEGVADNAITAAFSLLCEHRNIRPGDLLAISSNILNAAEGRHPEFAAVAHYMREELP